MKRLIAFAVTILTAFCLVSCSVPIKDKTTNPNGLNESFQASVNIVLDELNADGTIKRFGDGMWDVEFDSPNTLSGVNLSFSDGSVTASYKGLNFSVPQSALPVKAMMLNLIAAVDDLAKNEELSGVEENGLLTISGSLDGGNYTLAVDKNGSPVSFEMPNNKLSITFTNVTPISGETATEENTEAVTDADQEETTASETEEETTEATTE